MRGKGPSSGPSRILSHVRSPSTTQGAANKQGKTVNVTAGRNPSQSRREDGDLTMAQGYDAARMCALNLLARMKVELGDLDYVTRILKVVGMVNSTPDFTDQALVIDGASDLFHALYGDRGWHSRTAPGIAAAPGNIAVIVDCVVEVSSEAPPPTS